MHNRIKITNLRQGDKVIIFDVVGRKQLYFIGKEPIEEFDVRQLAVGVYFVQVIHAGKTTFNTKIIKY